MSNAGSDLSPSPGTPGEGRGEGTVLIIGYGNPLRGDDGLGHIAAQRLGERLHDDRVEIITSHQLMPEMCEPISRAAMVIFIDASAADPPGHVARTDIQPADNANVRETHELDPASLLGLARMLFGKSAQGILFSVGANDFHLREGLSPAADAGVNEVIGEAEQIVRDFLAHVKPL